MSAPKYILPLQEAFKSQAEPILAAQMKDYMRGQFAYFGLKAPVRKELTRMHRNKGGLIPEEEKEVIVKWCWNQPQREYQYFAMEMLDKVVKREESSIIVLYEYMITTKSWWDTIDYIATHLVGPYFKKFPDQIIPLTNRWMSSENVWLQRTCLLFQLKYKKDLNVALLEEFIEHLRLSKEFFIRKAIGWVLREYSKTNPDYVIDYVDKNDLSGLSKREALKWINR